VYAMRAGLPRAGDQSGRPGLRHRGGGGMSPVTTVLLVGVGGQGTILAGDVLARVAAAAGQDVKLSEVHGMSQRGGSVDTTVRFGERVFAPIVEPGGVDHLVAFEIIEAARWVGYLRPRGTLLVNRRVIQPLPVLTGAMPAPTGLPERLESEGAVFVDAERIACDVGSPRSANLVLMGALSTSLDLPADLWRSVIEGRVPPKTVQANLAAFERGREAAATDPV
jgi:indolepyruvate ferredoxin oxidoreductase beta subunit